jgi:hypothetical protein
MLVFSPSRAFSTSGSTHIIIKNYKKRSEKKRKKEKIEWHLMVRGMDVSDWMTVLGFPGNFFMHATKITFSLEMCV